MFKYLFGPIPSRRLGMSLGVDLVPKKVCSLNCVYCEVGETTKLTTDRLEYIKKENIKKELIDYFAQYPDPDFITFSGSGEPTLNIYIGEILDFIKELRPQIPVAVLTNGTMMADAKVRQAIMKADVVLPSLDAASEEVFQKINRPAAGIKVSDYVEGIVEFKKSFKGEIWLEIFILPGYNNHQEELDALKTIIQQIEPNSIQLNTLDRPGVLHNLQPCSHEELQAIADDWGIENTIIIASSTQRKKSKAYRDDTENAILQTIARRPCTLDDLSEILDLHRTEINKYLDVLENNGQIKRNEQERGVFYQKNDD